MGREPAKNTINWDRKFLYCSWHPFGKQNVRSNKYIISGSTNLPLVVTKKEVLCSRHIQLHLASHNNSHIHTKTGSVRRLSSLKESKEETSSSPESICSSSPCSLEEYSGSSWYGWMDIVLKSRYEVCLQKDDRKICVLTTWTSNHLTSSPQRALRGDQNGDRGKFELVLKASLERPKRKI